MAITTISKKSKAANAQKVNPLIFVIEDDKLQLEILKDHLESTTQGADIKVFGTAEECFSKMGSRKPAMAFIDLNLNSKVKTAMDGMKAGQKLKKLAPKCEIVVMSDPANRVESINKSLRESNMKFINKGSSAMGHWNPTNTTHGKFGVASFHLGDIGNISLDSKGHASYEMTTDAWNINGTDSTRNIVGRSIIIHSGVDDYVTQPAGNSGNRIGCGGIILN